MNRILIVVGRSGSGKTSALQVLEDLGFYTIDNLPPALISDVVEKLSQSDAMQHLALGIDVRGFGFEQFSMSDALQQLAQYGTVEVIYLTARTDVLLARYASSRRPHPLARRFDTLTECIEQEEQLLYPISRKALLVIDTSNKSIHDLRDSLSIKLGYKEKLTVIIQSFGFKHGIPLDADYVFDLRHLSNPYWQKELRGYSGQDEAVKQFLQADEQVNAMYEDILVFLQKWLPAFNQSHRHYLTVALGCTGGQHRSVYFANRLGEALRANWAVQVVHREMKHWS